MVLKKKNATFFIIFAVILPVKVILFYIYVILSIVKYKAILNISITNAIIKDIKSSSFY